MTFGRRSGTLVSTPLAAAQRRADQRQGTQMNRPKTYTIAAIVQFVLSVMMVVTSAQALLPGRSFTEGIPLPVQLMVLALGAIGLVSAYGVWRTQRWGVVLTILIRASDGLLAAPGVLFAPTPSLKAMAGAGILISIAVIVLLLWPKPRPSAA